MDRPEDDLAFDLGEEVPIGQVRWVFAETGAADQFTIQVSLDAEEWQTVATGENAPVGEWQSAPVWATARYVRFLFANPNGDAVLGGIAEVEVLAPPT